MQRLQYTARLAAVAALMAPALWAVDWEPVTPETLAITAPRIDPNADSETIFGRFGLRIGCWAGVSRRPWKPSICG